MNATGLNAFRTRVLAVGGVLVLISLTFALVWLSRFFSAGIPLSERAVLELTLLLILSGAVWLGIVSLSRRVAVSRPLLYGAFLAGLIMRGAYFFSIPMLEDDWNRYLWDGAVTARGINPWRWTPRDALDSRTNEEYPEALRELALEGTPVLERIGRPELVTGNPPAAQTVFSLAHRAAPWSLNGWRAMVMGLDLVLLLLLASVLARAGAPPAAWTVYWLNPLIVKEFYNSAHMDVAVLVLVMAALLAASRGKTVTAAIVLAGAVGAKLWPLVLFPLILRINRSDGVKTTAALVAFVLCLALLYFPVVKSGIGADSGLLAFGIWWEMNDALFMPVQWIWRWGTGSVGRDGITAQLGARATVALVVLGVLLHQIRHRWRSVDGMAARCLSVTAALFLLSPAPLPWYYSSVLIFLPFRPRFSVALLTVVLPLYYLRFFFEARGQTWIFDNWLVWLEFLPVLALLWWERSKSDYRRAGERRELLLFPD